MRSRLLAAAVAALVVAASGCGAHGPDSRITTLPSSATAATSAGEVTLPSLGYTYGPASLRFPPSIQVDRKIDQANTVGVFFKQPTTADAIAWFKAELPRAGFRIDAATSDSLLFGSGHWSGALTSGTDGTTAITLRKVG